MEDSTVLFMLLLGAALILIPVPAAVYDLVRQRRKRGTWVQVEAKVASTKKRAVPASGQYGPTSEYPTKLRFTDTGGQRRTFIKVYSSEPKKGSKVRVTYDPADPEQVEVISGARLYVPMTLAAAACAVGVWILIISL
ncbi:DUF3592 domain-containing protein [Phytoactinopolyspora limicola]|uniref:DUF3592 domain-containing protein n=1 Tax=Phytoactinopolyspora limicola TaxID=2715536 RepID=UPI001407D5F8|nr:DUF3592 domain-containing protein [Phytoactinopolyspora limicola]